MQNKIRELRVHAALVLLGFGFWLLPSGAYKSKLNAALWSLNLEMQATIAAARANQPART